MNHLSDLLYILPCWSLAIGVELLVASVLVNAVRKTDARLAREAEARK